MTEEDYRKDAAVKGYAEPVDKTWDATHSNELHTHEQSAYLLIKAGTATLGVDTTAGLVSTTLEPGSTIEVPAGCRHFEQAGATAVQFLVATK